MESGLARLVLSWLCVSDFHFQSPPRSTIGIRSTATASSTLAAALQASLSGMTPHQQEENSTIGTAVPSERRRYHSWPPSSNFESLLRVSTVSGFLGHLSRYH